MTMLRLCILVIAIVAVGIFLTYSVFSPMFYECQADKGRTVPCSDYVSLTFALTMIIPAMLTLFGLLAMPGAQNPDGTFREQRIRLSITTSTMVVYLIWFSLSLQWSRPGEKLDPMFETLTDLMKIIIPFYFGASAFAQWSEKQGQKPDQNQQTAPGRGSP